MSEFIKPFQIKTDRVRSMITMYETSLIDEVSLPAYKAYLAIKKYFAELLWSVDKKWKKYQPNGAKRAEIRKTNKLHITSELLLEYGGCPKCSTVKNTNSKAQSLLKQLIKVGVLYKISKDYYMVSPNYIYVEEKNIAIETAIWEWCSLTGEEYEESIWSEVLKVKDYSTGTISNDLTRSELEEAKRLSVPIAAHPETTEELKELLEEQVVETTAEIIARLRANSSPNIIHNANIIKQYGKDIAYECMPSDYYWRACNYLQELPF